MSHSDKPGLNSNGDLNMRRIRLMATTRAERKKARHGSTGTPADVAAKIERKKQEVLCAYSGSWFDGTAFGEVLKIAA